jgi:hypothetical protein
MLPILLGASVGQKVVLTTLTFLTVARRHPDVGHGSGSLTSIRTANTQ